MTEQRRWAISFWMNVVAVVTNVVLVLYGSTRFAALNVVLATITAVFALVSGAVWWSLRSESRGK